MFAQGEGAPFDFDWEGEEWVLAGIALRDTVELYASVYGDRERALQEAVDAIRHRLLSGALWSRSPKWSHTVIYQGVAPEMEQLFEPIIDIGDAEVAIDPSFWINLAGAELATNLDDELGVSSARVDWVAGDVEFSRQVRVTNGGITGIQIEGRALGLCFNRSGLPTTQRIASGAFRKPKPAVDQRPPLSDAMLRSWWASLDDEQRAQRREDLEALCRAAFPQYRISRDRVRELDPGRKRGPKPISGKATA